MDEFLTPEAFREWLSGKYVNAAVGYAGNKCHCPLAAYLKDRTGFECSVGLGEVVVRNRPPLNVAETHRIPQWASDFIILVDRKEKHTPISAGAALDMLLCATSNRGIIPL